MRLSFISTSASTLASKVQKVNIEQTAMLKRHLSKDVWNIAVISTFGIIKNETKFKTHLRCLLSAQCLQKTRILKKFGFFQMCLVNVHVTIYL